MENLIVKITQLYEKHKGSPKTLQKLSYYIDKQLPALLERKLLIYLLPSFSKNKSLFS